MTRKPRSHVRILILSSDKYWKWSWKWFLPKEHWSFASRCLALVTAAKTLGLGSDKGTSSVCAFSVMFANEKKNKNISDKLPWSHFDVILFKMCIKNQKHITLKRVALLKWGGLLENQLSSKFTWYRHFIIKRPPWLNNFYYYYYYYYYYYHYHYYYYYYFIIRNYRNARQSCKCLIWKPRFAM